MIGYVMTCRWILVESVRSPVGVEVFGERINCQSYTWLLTEFRIWRGVKSDVNDGQG